MFSHLRGGRVCRLVGSCVVGASEESGCAYVCERERECVCLQSCTARIAMAPMRMICFLIHFAFFGRRHTGSGRLCAAVGGTGAW